MQTIRIPDEHALVQMSNSEIDFLWHAINYVREAMTSEAFKDQFEMSPKYADDLCSKLSDALEIANKNMRST
jgi:hypothetical protein